MAKTAKCWRRVGESNSCSRICNPRIAVENKGKNCKKGQKGILKALGNPGLMYTFSGHFGLFSRPRVNPIYALSTVFRNLLGRPQEAAR